MIVLTATALATFLIATALTPVLREIALRRSLLDNPNARSAHEVPTPRLGGVALALSFLGAAAAVSVRGGVEGSGPILACTALIAALGLVDDLRPLPARLRLAMQLVCAATVVAAAGPAWAEAHGVEGPVAWLAAVAGTVAIVWSTNLYNFMDGVDGLAGGQAVLAALGIAGAAALGSELGVVAMLVALAGASAGFLVHNFPRARIFMGDAGSTAIGFFLGCTPLLAAGRSVPVASVLLALALFLLDATTTLVARILRGERWYEAHRSHWYQRPLALGVPHRRITATALAGMVPCAIAAAAWPVAPGPARGALALIPLAIFLFMVAAVRRLEARGPIVQGSGR
ncbi:MAG: glycosyltransferase family 4 protein [Anaeromyxobacteraceae bacterium]